MNGFRVLLLACLLLIPVGFGCGKKAGSSSASEATTGKPGNTSAAVTKDTLLGAWVLEKSETGGQPGKDVWEFKGGGYEKKETFTLKTVSDKALTLGREKDTDLKYERKGAAPAGKSKLDKLLGRWQGGDEYRVFTKDGKWVYGVKSQDDDGKPIDAEVWWGTFTVDGDKLTLLQKADGKVEIKVEGGSMSDPWEMKGDKLTVSGGFMGKLIYTVKADTDNRLVLVNDKGKKIEFKKQASSPGGGSK